MVATDNTQVQGWINTGRSSNPYAMAWLREIFWVSAFFNLSIRACRVSSKDNVLADALSRLNTVDSNTICDFHIDGFANCCRVARAARGMEYCEESLLRREHLEIEEEPVEALS